MKYTWPFRLFGDMSSWICCCCLFVFSVFCSRGRGGSGKGMDINPAPSMCQISCYIILGLAFGWHALARLADGLWPASVLIYWYPSPAIYTLLTILVLLLLHFIFKINFQEGEKTESPTRDPWPWLCLLLPILPRGGFLACASSVLELGEPDVCKHFFSSYMEVPGP